MNLQPNDPLRLDDADVEFATLRIREMGLLGDGVAIFEEDEIPVFGGLVGELVKARIYRYSRRKKNLITAIVIEVIESSPKRVKPPCQYFISCSGCQWQHMEYSSQLIEKRNYVVKQMREYENLKEVSIEASLPSPQQYNYRNHARFTVRFGGQLGFSNRITRRFVKVDECRLMDPLINETLSGIQGKCTETSNLSVRVGSNTGDRLIQPTLSNPEIPYETGQKWYRERLNNTEFRVASPSFFQVNTKQAELMIKLVVDNFELCGHETVVDAYAGVGTFAIELASKVGQVIAIEESLSAVKDSSYILGHVDNVDFKLGKTEDVLPTLDHEVDALIIDPPRVGCHPNVLNSIIGLSPLKIAYVSCDPVTLARDLNILVSGGYQVTRIEPIDMFPQTHHVECVAMLRFA